MENKKIWLLTLMSFVLLTMDSPAAYALDCTSFNVPKETKDYVVVITEEAFGTAGLETRKDETDVFQCFRQTDCTKPADDPKCQSTYVEQCSPGQGISCKKVQIYVSKTGAGLLYAYIGQIYRWAAVVIGSVCVLFMVVGGVQIATAGDNSENLNNAKTRIIQSIAGLVLLLMSAVILYTINPNFFTI